MVAPIIRVNQCGRVNWVTAMYVGIAAIADAVRILVDDFQSIVAL